MIDFGAINAVYAVPECPNPESILVVDEQSHNLQLAAIEPGYDKRLPRAVRKLLQSYTGPGVRKSHPQRAVRSGRKGTRPRRTDIRSQRTGVVRLE